MLKLGQGLKICRLDFGPDEENPVADAVPYSRWQVRGEAQPVVEVAENSAADDAQRYGDPAIAGGSEETARR